MLMLMFKYGTIQVVWANKTRSMVFAVGFGQQAPTAQTSLALWHHEDWQENVWCVATASSVLLII